MRTEEKDLVIIGGGPGGYALAIRSSQYGRSVTLIEQARLGGTCLHRGCIPTKALVASADAYRRAKSMRALGIDAGAASVDFDAVMERKASVVAKLARGVEALMKKNRVEVVTGAARFCGSHELAVKTADGTRPLLAKQIVIATGSSIIEPPAFAFDGEWVMTSDDILELAELPKSLLVVGAGVVGCEFAGIFSRFGADVTLLDLAETILPNEDAEMREALRKELLSQGIKVRTGVRIEALSRNGDGVTARLSGGEALAAERALVAVGRRPNTVGLALEAAGIALGKQGEIEIDDRMQTAIPHIFAIGDVTAKLPLAHAATAQALALAEVLSGRERTLDYKAIPSCVFTFPELASAGLAEEEARARYSDVSVGRFSFRNSGKALAEGDTDGFVKVIAARDKKVLGVHILGPHAGELIAQAAIVLAAGGDCDMVRGAVYAHPTLSESLFEAFDAAAGMGLHQ